jgi:phosphopantothenoylcysteine decarboxylase/phosphopantothenate--cysteine ligase
VRPFDGRTILLVVSGGIAAYKSVILVRRLMEAGAGVDVVMTESAGKFVGSATFEGITGRAVHSDLWERPMAHLELGVDADAVVVAPATADLLARMAAGRADDLASTALLAADAPLLAAPAMNSRMWRHPATKQNVEILEDRGVVMVGPEHGPLAEGEVGPGRMAEPGAVLAETGRLLERASRPDSPLAGSTVVVTAGPTRAPMDPVRYLGNRSSGRMGYAVAGEAWRRGARVELVTGPGTVEPPYGPRVRRVERSREMLDALRDLLPGSRALIMVAAVSDFEFAEERERKIKRGERETLEVTLRAGPDLLMETRELRREEDIYTVGFALETEDGVDNARGKLESKDLDLVALNEAGRPDTGFESSTNQLTLLGPAGEEASLPLLPKEEAAEVLLDHVEAGLEG